MTPQALSSDEKWRLTDYARRLLAVTLHRASKTYLRTSYDTCGWRTGFEFLVWDLLVQTEELVPLDVQRGRDLIRNELEELLQLTRDAGGWMTWSPVLNKLVFVTAADWSDLYERYRRPLSDAPRNQ